MNQENIKPNEPFDAEKEKAEYKKYLLSQKYVDHKNELIPIKSKELEKKVANKKM